MKIKTIKKEIAIDAPKDKVWEVLLEEKYNSIWCSEFSKGTKAETDWQLGSKARFTDHSGSGIYGHVIEHKTAEAIAVEFDGMILNGQEDHESDQSNQVQGSRERYVLSEHNGITTLNISADMLEEYFETMSQAWDRALQKLKDLAENKLEPSI